MWRPRLRSLAVAIAIVGSPGCQLILDFDVKPDAGPPAAACELHEPNNTRDVATSIASGPYEPAICPAGDVDFYSFDVPDSFQTVSIQVDPRMSEHEASEMSLRLYDSTGALVVIGAVVGEAQFVQCPGTNPTCPMLSTGTYTFEVAANPGVDTFYRLFLDVSM